MMTAPASAAEPRHISGGAGGAGRGQSVKVPLRLVVGAQYGDAALSVYVKIAALALRKEHCTARVTTLATYLGMSKSAVERALKQLTRPDETDGLVEVPTRRRTYEDGRGQSAERTVRPLADGELWVHIPVRAAEALTPRLLRLYALLAYATARRIPVTVAELGEMLHHHSGGKAGLHLSERQVRRLVDELEATGWLAVHRREGERGRHAYETRRHPLHLVGATAATLEQDLTAAPKSPVIHDGSGPGDHDGSLASEEDLPTDRPESAELEGGSRRRRNTVSKPAINASDLAGGTFGPGTSRAPRGNRPSRPGTSKTASRAAYNGPAFRWTKRIKDALAPISGQDLDGIRVHVLRQIARQIAAELDANEASSSARIADRISRRLRPVMREDIRSIGGWLLKVGLPHRGCNLRDCEDGMQWPSGEPCETCAYTRQLERAWWKQARELQSRLDELRARATAEAELPAKATFRQRSAASDEEIRAAIAEYGPIGALHIYGQLRVGPLLRTTDVQGQLPAPTAPARTQLAERPIPGRMPDTVRADVRPTGHALAVACPNPACRAPAGHACTTPRGRRRHTPHEARTDAIPTAASYPAASGEDTV
ncbi:hypothetical protein [Streptomyces phaeochromogenes]|uniref:zinc finger domain-containing protein n=1 Tax=Streptomyces phaeochromogenes TaxID=1923 RepID=UPI002DD86EDE|nr:hypothetical protein [Streptomyces phaeochromogenes]WRZ30223.1 helix-turn-helix domain-containing protein [Streptomyces phaeochromogenes]